MIFFYKGEKFINGYPCDAAGRPITQKTGYTEEEEREAREHYLDVRKEIDKNFFYIHEIKPIKEKRYSKKITISPIENLTDDFLEEEKKMYDEDGYMLNDAGQAINLENGYTDDDINTTRKQF